MGLHAVAVAWRALVQFPRHQPEAFGPARPLGVWQLKQGLPLAAECEEGGQQGMARRPVRGIGAGCRGGAVQRLVREQQHPAHGRAERGAVMQFARRDHEQAAGFGRV